MNVVEKRAESFARRLERRRFLNKAAGGLFAGITLALVGPTGRAMATGPCPNSSEPTFCRPPRGVFCSGCSGERCPSGCSLWRGEYSDGCWCSKSFACQTCYLCWYKCCDCSCPSGLCGCRRIISNRLAAPC